MEPVADETLISINRPVYTQKLFDAEFPPGEDEEQSLRSRFSASAQRNCPPSGAKVCAAAESLIPAATTLRKYNVKKDLFRDIVAGATVSCMHIPQGMAYGQLAGLTPVYGLYVSFLPSLLYFFFGTSRHISMGTFAVLSLMLAKVIETELFTPDGVVLPGPNGTDYNVTMSDKVAVVMSVSLMAGLIQLLMAVFQLGFLTMYLSEPVVSGFTTACAVHVFTSQIKYVFGVQLASQTGAFKVFLTYKDLILSLGETNYVTFLLSIAAGLFLILFKELINPRVKARFHSEIPVELLIIIMATAVSYLLKLDGMYDVGIVGEVPPGMVEPRVPPFFSLKPPSLYLRFRMSMVMDASLLAIISVAVTISMGKLLGRRNNYAIRPNQELLALGLVNIVGSFFSCFVSSASLSRSLVQEGVGGQTQLASVFSSIVIFLVLMWIGPLFTFLPKCILAVVVIVNLKGMFKQVMDMKKFWIHSKPDAIVWLVAFVVTVVVDIDVGLFAGVAALLVTVLSRAQRLKPAVLARAGDTEIFADVESYKELSGEDDVRIVRPRRPLHFATAEEFTSLIVGLCVPDESLTSSTSKFPAGRPSTIVVDCAAWSYIDSVGLNTLSLVIGELDILGVRLLLASCSPELVKMLQRHETLEPLLPQMLFVAVVDAVVRARSLSAGEAQQTTPPSAIVQTPRRSVNGTVSLAERTPLTCDDELASP